MRWESILGGAGEDFSKNVAAEQRDGRAFSTGRRGQEAGRSPSALDTASAKSQEGESKDRLGASVGSTGETGAGTEGIVRNLICVSKRWDPLARFKDIGIRAAGGLSVTEFDQT